jgi:hypothetical protein
MNTERYLRDAVFWQDLSRNAYVRAMLFPNADRQQRAAHFSHMARRALFSLVSGPRTKESP